LLAEYRDMADIVLKIPERGHGRGCVQNSNMRGETETIKNPSIMAPNIIRLI
jgi:hypothetical protein